MAKALPTNTELWSEPVAVVECEHCGPFDVPDSHATVVQMTDLHCPSCERQTVVSLNRLNMRTAFWFWFCMPGCLPDSSVYGPFETEDEAINEARNHAGSDDDESEG